MFIVRIEAFLKNRQTQFWCVAFAFLFVFLAFVPNFPIGFGRKIEVTEQTVPGMIIVFSLIATSIWCYTWMLVPVIRNREIFDDRKASGIIFHLLFFSIIAMGLLLTIIYLVALSNTNGGSGSLAVEKTFESAIPVLGPFLGQHHLLIFVASYSLLDLIVGTSSSDPQVKSRFADVFVFVDIPMMATMAFALYVIRDQMGSVFYYAEAGIVAFQLVAGSFSVIGFEVIEELLTRAGGGAISETAHEIDGTDAPAA